MLHWADSTGPSESATSARWKASKCGYELGKWTGLPLIQCSYCKIHQVVELKTMKDEKENKGRIFFECPSNYEGVSSRAD